MKNAAVKGFLERFDALLEALDELDGGEELEELNAQFEDAIFLMECTDPDAERDEFCGALEEIEGLLAEYRALSERVPGLRQKVLELEMAVRMAGANLA